MSTDNNGDKTVFMNLSPSGVAIPNPGGRIKATPQPEAAIAPAASNDGIQVNMNLSSGQNRLLNAATTLLAVLTSLRNTLTAPNLPQLQADLATEIRAFDTKVRGYGSREEESQVARYILCTAMDEAILSTPWGADSGWGQRSLLRIFHNETNGGEKFFALLSGVKARHLEFRELLELFQVILTLGFRGRFQLDAQGNEKLEQIREDLFTTLYGSQSFNRTLSPNWQSNALGDPGLMKVIPLWVTLSIVLAVTLAVFTGLRIGLSSDTAEIAALFADIER